MKIILEAEVREDARMRIVRWKLWLIVFCFVGFAAVVILGAPPAKTAAPPEVGLEARVKELEAKVKILEPAVKNIEEHLQRRGSRY